MVRFIRKKLILPLGIIFFVSILYFFNFLFRINAESSNNVPVVSQTVASEAQLFEGIAPVREELSENNGVKENNTKDNSITNTTNQESQVIGNQQSTAVNYENLNIGKPARLIIPKIGVNANIEHIGLTNGGAVGAPEGAYDTSWFDLGPKPGEKGNALISGHSGIWKDGSHSIFDNLHILKAGDTIYVSDTSGKKRSFIVKELRVYDKDDFVSELFSESDNVNLNIITCHGDWIASQKTYSERLVVFTEII